MPLPKQNTAWPPREWAPAFDRYRFDEALWLNDTELLGSMLRGAAGGNEEGRAAAERARRGFFASIMRRWGWARITPPNEKRTDMPVPFAAGLVDLSAAQLMAEAPMFRLLDQDGNVRRGRARRPGDTVDNMQARLDIVANSDDAHMTLIEGAQLAAALGGVVLKAAWDADDPDRESVWFDVVGADCAVPEFNAFGRLTAVTLFTTYPAKSNRVYRHLERHAVGYVEHALYLGTERGIGKLVPLTEVASLEGLAATPGATLTDDVLQINTGLSRPTAQFWRNRPTRAWRHDGALANLGRSDFELVEPLLDAYSEAWGSMLRDVRLGKARAFLPQGVLERIGTGQGGLFDADREFYQEVGGLNPDAGADAIKVEQPEIRWQAHMNVLAGIKLEALDEIGWSQASYGNPLSVGGSGGAVTATEVVDRTTKSERTRDEKALYFAQPANPFFRMLLELDGLIYPGRGGGVVQDELSIDFPDVSQVDPEKQARTFLDLSTARAISIEQTVRERRPNWDNDEVDEEVARIMADLDRVAGGAVDPTRVGQAREQIDLTDPAAVDDEQQQPEPVAADA